MGVALGRFQPGVTGALGHGQFAAHTVCELCNQIEKNGIMVLEEGHPDDLARRVLNILNTIYGDSETERIVRAATGSTVALRDAVEDYFAGELFRDHMKRYPLQTTYHRCSIKRKSLALHSCQSRGGQRQIAENL